MTRMRAPAVGLDRVARLDVGGAIGAHDLPVGAAGQDAAGQPRALDPAAEDRDDAPLAIGRGAEIQDAGQLGMDREDRCLTA